MVLYELGYPAIAFSSEAIPTKGETGKFVKDYINRLKEKFEHIILFLDNDEPGIKLSQKASRAFSLPYVTTPEKEPKDISDYLLKHGKRKTHRTVKQLIKKYLKNEQTTDAKLASEFDSFVSDSSLHSISLDALFGEQPNGENADAANPT